MKPNILLTMLLIGSIAITSASCFLIPTDKDSVSLKDLLHGLIPVEEAPKSSLTTGAEVNLGSETIDASGGTIAIDKPGDPLDGFNLEVPPDAYAEPTSFEVSYAPVTGHAFGEDFNPASPLITVDNGGAYAAEIMEIRVPVKVPQGYFAMGFFYDDKTDKLEGMPTLGVNADSITVGTQHFTSFLISMIPDTKLKTDIDSGFRPGIDDWQFTNHGSYISPGGHCSGQSETAMWYYCTQPDGKDLTLYGRYDNNGNEPATPGFDDDDSFGIRFASVVQADQANMKETWGKQLFRDQRGLNDELSWKAFAYSIQLTGEPQYVTMADENGDGHAMICCRIYQGNLYVADPNYPGNTERRIEYAKGKFTPYESGANREEIDKGNSIRYTKIGYAAKTAMVDWSKIAQHWTEFKNKTIGNDKFPAYQIVYVDDKGAVHELADGYVSPDKLIDMSASSNTFDALCDVYRDGKKLWFDANGKYDLNPGNNRLGVAVYGKVDGKSKYVDFKYLNVVYGEPSSAPPAEPATPAPTAADHLARLQAMKSIMVDIGPNMVYDVWRPPQYGGALGSLPVSSTLSIPGNWIAELSTMPIAWDGTSFSGRYESPTKAVHSISGQVTPDGNTLLRLDYTYADLNGPKGTTGYSRRASEISLVNFPIWSSYDEPSNSLEGTDAAKCIDKIKDQSDGYYTYQDQKWEARTYVSTDWATSALAVNFGTKIDPWVTGGENGVFTYQP